MKQDKEQSRIDLQIILDDGKSQKERNKLGQFATPTILARQIINKCLEYFPQNKDIVFIDPAIGTGSFYSALIHEVKENRVKKAVGYEVDSYYGLPSKRLWNDTELEIRIDDFTKNNPDLESEKYNLLVCNPPYVRHHHIKNGEKQRLRNASFENCGYYINGLSGLYCYFICIAHSWMKKDGIAAWLVPSEFLDVNYGEKIKEYLLNKVTLLNIHRFNPNELQFNDALVSSSVIIFRNTPPENKHNIIFSFGSSLIMPLKSRKISREKLNPKLKWSNLALFDTHASVNFHKRLSDYFIIKRGVATGSNKFFILSLSQIKAKKLPLEFFVPILPSPRYLNENEINADDKGFPKIQRRLFLLNCPLPSNEIKIKYPDLWQYLESGMPEVSSRYLCSKRDPWYIQEKREPSPLLCTYMGRGNNGDSIPVRFILNHSKAIAANVYLMLYPKAILKAYIEKNADLLRKIWIYLNNIEPDHLIKNGRVYGGGLYKFEPSELSNIPFDMNAIFSDFVLPEQLVLI